MSEVENTIAVIDFKHVGIRPSLPETDEEIHNRVPIGLRSPMRYGNDEIWETNKKLNVEIRQNLRDLVMTNWGERIGRYRFGANLQELTTEFASPNFAEEVTIRIKTAVNKWMPYVNLLGFKATVENDPPQDFAKIRFFITYEVTQAGLNNQALEVILYNAG